MQSLLRTDVVHDRPRGMLRVLGANSRPRDCYVTLETRVSRATFTDLNRLARRDLCGRKVKGSTPIARFNRLIVVFLECFTGRETSKCTAHSCGATLGKIYEKKEARQSTGKQALSRLSRLGRKMASRPGLDERARHCGTRVRCYHRRH